MIFSIDREAGRLARLEETQEVACVRLPFLKFDELASHRVASVGQEVDQVASHARAVRNGQRLVFLEERQTVDEHARVAGIGEEEMDAADV